jgi:hypothetical protein
MKPNVLQGEAHLRRSRRFLVEETWAPLLFAFDPQKARPFS